MVAFAHALAIEMNHLEALERLFQVYAVQELSGELIVNAVVRAGRRHGPSDPIKALASRNGIIGKPEKEGLGRLLLQAVKDGDESSAGALLLFVDSADVLNRGLYMAAQAGHTSLVGMMLRGGGQRASLDTGAALQLARLKGHRALANYLALVTGAKTPKGDPPSVDVVEGHLPADDPASWAEYRLVAALYEGGFGRFVVQFTAGRDPSLLHRVLIEGAVGEDENASGSPVSLHTALQGIADGLQHGAGQPHLAPFMVACAEGFEDVVEAYIRDGRVKAYGEAPCFKGFCLVRACANRHAQVLPRLIRAFRYDPDALSGALINAATAGDLPSVRVLVDDGQADPVGAGNAAFIGACTGGHAAVIWYLFGLPAVKGHRLTPGPLGFHLLAVQDMAMIRRLFLGSPPAIAFHPKSLYSARAPRYEGAVGEFFADPALVGLLGRSDDTKVVADLFGSFVRHGRLGIVRAFLRHIDGFGGAFVRASLASHLVTTAALAGHKDVVVELLDHPRRSRRNRFRLQVRMLQRYSSERYVTPDFIDEVRAFPVLRTHLRYYLSSRVLHRLFPEQADWDTDEFLGSVARTDALPRRGGPSEQERFRVNLFFDKSGGLFGDTGGTEIDGGTVLLDRFIWPMLQAMEQRRPLPASGQWGALKDHLARVSAVATAPGMWEPSQGAVKEDVRRLAPGDTYLLSLATGGHLAFALVTRLEGARLNVKVFNAYHSIITYDAGRRKDPYVEWEGVPLEEFLARDLYRFPSPDFALSKAVPPGLPRGLPAHMKTKGQRTGSCPAFRFWLVARHDLGTLPRFLEFSVALHLAFIEDLAANFGERMAEWGARFPRAWLAAIRTPHFEGQLLKDIEGMKDAGEMYEKVRGQIVQSVRGRYRKIYPEHEHDWDDDAFVVDFIRWRERLLDNAHEGVDDPAP
jgi:hypothetical protein